MPAYFMPDDFMPGDKQQSFPSAAKAELHATNAMQVNEIKSLRAKVAALEEKLQEKATSAAGVPSDEASSVIFQQSFAEDSANDEPPSFPVKSTASIIERAGRSFTPAIFAPAAALLKDSLAHSDTTGMQTHMVRPGETLASIAMRYQVRRSQLAKENSLLTSSVAAGQVLRIPRPEDVTDDAASCSTPSSCSTDLERHLNVDDGARARALRRAEREAQRDARRAERDATLKYLAPGGPAERDSDAALGNMMGAAGRTMGGLTFGWWLTGPH